MGKTDILRSARFQVEGLGRARAGRGTISAMAPANQIRELVVALHTLTSLPPRDDCLELLGLREADRTLTPALE